MLIRVNPISKKIRISLTFELNMITLIQRVVIAADEEQAKPIIHFMCDDRFFFIIKWF